ncbi:hypothetical protein GCM10027195_13940 [Comamonas sediminis]
MPDFTLSGSALPEASGCGMPPSLWRGLQVVKAGGGMVAPYLEAGARCSAAEGGVATGPAVMAPFKSASTSEVTMASPARTIKLPTQRRSNVAGFSRRVLLGAVACEDGDNMDFIATPRQRNTGIGSVLRHSCPGKGQVELTRQA